MFSTFPNILMAFGALQGFFLVAILPRLKNANRNSNKVLSQLLVCVSLIQVFRLVGPYWPPTIPLGLRVFTDTLSYFFGPLIYLYIRKSLFSDTGITSKTFLYFIPGMLHIIYVFSLLRFSNEEFYARIVSGAFKPWWITNSIGISVVNLFFWWKSYISCKEAKELAKDTFSFDQKMTFLSVILYIVLFCFILWFCFLGHLFLGWNIPVITDTNMGWLVIPFTIYFIAYTVIVKQDVFLLPVRNFRTSYSLENNEVTAIREKIENIMADEKSYLDPDLTLTDLATLIDVNPTKLSRIINTSYQCNFYDFINSYRVREFIRQINKNTLRQHTLLAIAYDSGFKSKSTFNKSFKKVMQITPTLYIKNQLEDGKLQLN